ncbi:MAG: glycosyltransferase family 2 protein [Solirubrobacteraceae bacterium]
MKIDNSNNKVSVIIPIYNAEKTLVKCLESVVNQTYKNIEIILINDGSSDKSEVIIKKYLDQDSRFVYHKQKNSGLAFTRNVAIKLSTTDYICFIDSDDYVEENYVELLLTNLLTHDADISVGEVNYVFTVDDYLNSQVNIQEEIKIIDTNESLKLIFLDQEIRSYAWMKIYKKSLFENVFYPENMNTFQDMATTYKLFSKSKKIVISNQKIYNYVYFPNSNSNGKLIQNYFNYFNGTHELYLASQDYTFDFNYRTLLMKKTLRELFNSTNKIISNTNFKNYTYEFKLLVQKLKYYLKMSVFAIGIKNFLKLLLIIYLPTFYIKYFKIKS